MSLFYFLFLPWFPVTIVYLIPFIYLPFLLLYRRVSGIFILVSNLNFIRILSFFTLFPVSLILLYILFLFIIFCLFVCFFFMESDTCVLRQFFWNKTLYPDAFRKLCWYLTCSHYVLPLIISSYNVTNILTIFELLKGKGCIGSGDEINICWLLGVHSHRHHPGRGKISSGLSTWWLVSSFL